MGKFLQKFLLVALLLMFLSWRNTPAYAADFVDGGGAGSGQVTNALNLTGTNTNPTLLDQNKAAEAQNKGLVNGGATAEFFMNSMGWGFVRGTIGDSSGSTGTGTAASPNRGAIGFFSQSITAMVTQPPVSGVEYIAYLRDNLSPPWTIPSAYAASGGIGYTQLNPILSVWTVSRNLAYLTLTIVFVVIAFMVIFRVKIDPKTVASVQSALPKIFIAFLLITFSYAIAGLLIDLMYVLIGLVVNLVAGIKGLDPAVTNDIADVSKALPTGSIFDIFGSKKFFSVAGSSSAAIGEIVANFLDVNQKGGSFAGFLGFGASLIAWVIITAAILFALFKTWLALLNAYVQIILGVISAPLFLMVEAIPGRSVWGLWLRNMLSNILVFPFIILMILIGYVLTQGWSNTNGFVPPLIGGNSPGAIQGLIGLAVILTMPKAINILQEFLKTPPFKYGMAWSEAVQGGLGFTQAAGKYGYEQTLGKERAAIALQNKQRKEYDLEQQAIQSGRVPAGYVPKAYQPPPKGWKEKILGIGT